MFLFNNKYLFIFQTNQITESNQISEQNEKYISEAF